MSVMWRNISVQLSLAIFIGDLLTSLIKEAPVTSKKKLLWELWLVATVHLSIHLSIQVLPPRDTHTHRTYI